LAGEFFGRLLIAQLQRRFAVPKNEPGVVETDAGDGAFGVIRSHAHGGVVALGAFAISDRSSERLFRRSRTENRDTEHNADQAFAHGSIVSPDPWRRL